jgi:hypothetical protein
LKLYKTYHHLSVTYENLKKVGSACFVCYVFFSTCLLSFTHFTSQRLELESARWQGQSFDPDSEQLIINKDDPVYICAKTVIGASQCCYAVCANCYFDNMSPANEKRGSKRVKVTDTKRQDSPLTKNMFNAVTNCKLQDLQLATDLYWCEPDRKDKAGLFSWTWLQHVKGCVMDTTKCLCK